MDITRDTAINILRYLHEHDIVDFPFLVMCQEYTPEDDDFVEVEPDEWEMIAEDPDYQTFQLWGSTMSLHSVKEETRNLLAQAFIEKITQKTL